jgi:hypothetical protein
MVSCQTALDNDISKINPKERNYFVMFKRLIAWLFCALIVVLAGCGPTAPSTQEAQAPAQPTVETQVAQSTIEPEAAAEVTPSPETTVAAMPLPEATAAPTPSPETTVPSTPSPQPTEEPTEPQEPEATIAAQEPAEDWQRVEILGLALALPQHWTIIGADEAQEGAPDATPEAGFALPGAEGQPAPEPAPEPEQLMVYDFSDDRTDESGYIANLRMAGEPQLEAPELSEIAEADEQELADQEDVENIERTRYRIGDHDAIQLHWKVSTETPLGQPLNLAAERYLLVIGTNVYRIEFTMPEALASEYRTEIDQILATLRAQTQAEG